MRLTLYASFLIISCALIQTTLADSRSYKRSIKDEEDSSVERPPKDKRVKKGNSKYRTDVSDTSEEDLKINKRISRKPWEEDHDFPKEKKYSKYTKKANKFTDDSEEESSSTRKNKRSFDGRNDQDKQGNGKKFGKKKTLVTDKDSDEDSDEESAESKERLVKKHGEKYSKFEEDTSAEKNTKTKKFPSKRVKVDDDDDDDDDSEEETAKFEKKFSRKTKKPADDSDEVEEEPKKIFRKKIRVRVPDSPEDDSDESEEDACQRSKKGKGQKSCPAKESANGNDDTTEEPVRAKKIKYSIKFAHEKERSAPAEDSNIMLKIHRGEKKKYRYQDDDDDDSSEENSFPKRIRFLDDDDE